MLHIIVNHSPIDFFFCSEIIYWILRLNKFFTVEECKKKEGGIFMAEWSSWEELRGKMINWQAPIKLSPALKLPEEAKTADDFNIIDAFL